jgi:hypothetical protein
MKKQKPARRSALNKPMEANQAPTPVVPTTLDMIAAPKKRGRGREWDHAHHAWSYKIPEALRPKAEEIRDAITGIAHAGAVSADEIALALITLALSHVERGIFSFHGHPDPRRQKMSVTWEEVEAREAREIPIPKERSKKRAPERKSLYLAYRWPRPIHESICEISGNIYARGEVVVVLLQHSLEAYHRGTLRLNVQPRVINGEWA